MTVDSLQHGGAIVVVPHSKPKALRDIHSLIELSESNLGESILGFWKSCIHVKTSTDKGICNHPTREWNIEKTAVRASAEAIGHLTAADGCVVLDSKLRVIGFSGKIQVNEETLDKSGRSLVNGYGAPICEKQLFSKYGTRHLSAFRLCKASEGVMVFVFSQDGDLRLFASDEKHVYFFDHLSPALLQVDAA
jgi:hypothetical protein